ncbi:hypothetical protein [Streptomyces halobius]|nr:hypothetical protein [Streptomyces halobius]
MYALAALILLATVVLFTLTVLALTGELWHTNGTGPLNEGH